MAYLEDWLIWASSPEECNQVYLLGSQSHDKMGFSREQDQVAHNVKFSFQKVMCHMGHAISVVVSTGGQKEKDNERSHEVHSCSSYLEKPVEESVGFPSNCLPD